MLKLDSLLRHGADEEPADAALTKKWLKQAVADGGDFEAIYTLVFCPGTKCARTVPWLEPYLLILLLDTTRANELHERT